MWKVSTGYGTSSKTPHPPHLEFLRGVNDVMNVTFYGNAGKSPADFDAGFLKDIMAFLMAPNVSPFSNLSSN